MTAIIDRYRGARYSHKAVADRFDRTMTRKPEAYFLFFEGAHDQAYYLPMVRKFIKEDDEVYCFICDGKSGIRNAIDHAESRSITSTNVMFFADRDLDDYVGNTQPANNNCYITDFYSVESYMISLDVFKKACQNTLCIDADEAFVDAIHSAFDGMLRRLYRVLRPLMAWTIHHRSMGIKVNLNNVDMAALVDILPDLSLRRKSKAFAEFKKLTGVTEEAIDREAIRARLRQLNSSDPRLYARGHYCMNVYLKWMDALRAHLRGICKPKEKKPFLDVHINSDNVIQLMLPNCSMPKSLSSFLEHRCGEISAKGHVSRNASV